MCLQQKVRFEPIFVTFFMLLFDFSAFKKKYRDHPSSTQKLPAFQYICLTACIKAIAYKEVKF